MSDKIIATGSVTKIEISKGDQVETYTDSWGNTRTKTIKGKGKPGVVQSTITLSGKIQLNKDSKSITFDETLEFGKEYEIVLREKPKSKETGRAFLEPTEVVK